MPRVVFVVLSLVTFLARGAELSLNGPWRFALAPDAAAADAQFAEASSSEFAAAGFRDLPVPGVWSLHGFEEPRYDRPTHAEGFYRHTFTVPADFAGQRVLLHFGGVWQSAEVWLNGQRLGRNDSGFTAFSFDVSAQVQPGAANVLAVRVRQRTPEFLFDCNDDWVFPGIYRDVWLETQPRDLALDRIEVATDFDADYRDATLRVRALLLHWPAGEKRFTLRAVLRDAAGHAVAQREVSGTVPGRIFLGATGREVQVELPVSTPHAWTAETPYLYSLAVELLDGGQVVHRRAERVGFREIAWEGGVLKLNGRPIKLRGVARHDEHPLVGRATRAEHWREDLALMRAANINAIRTAHYPPAAGFLELCDELGFYVIDEIPFGKSNELLQDPAFANAALARARATLARDRNRPSVIVWSVGNEDPFTATHLDVLRAIKGLDPTRPTLLPYRHEQELPPEVDLLAPHYLAADEYRALAQVSTRPIITTEYNHALGGHDFGDLARRWQVLRDHPRVAGGCIWLWADQAVRRHVAGRPVLDPLRDLGRYPDEGSDLVKHSDAGEGYIWDAHGAAGADGIVDPDRTPQRDYWETKAVYAPVRLLAHRRVGNTLILSVANEHDFIGLRGFRLGWTFERDGRPLSEGSAGLQAAAGATEEIELQHAPEAEFVRLRFLRPDGTELGNTAIEVAPPVPAMDSAPTPPRGMPALTRTHEGCIVETATARFTFLRATGGVGIADARGRERVRGIRPSLWRTPSLAELHYFRKFNKGVPDPVDLDAAAIGDVTQWHVTEQSGAVHVETGVHYRVNDSNSFAVTYRFVVSGDGRLRVSYTIAPEVRAPWLPHAGLELVMAESEPVPRVRWRGLGPWESYPNQHAAVSPGIWSDPNPVGVRSGTSWVEVGEEIKVTGAPHFEWRGDTRSLRLLQAVQARFNKNRAPDVADQMIDPKRPVAGEFEVQLLSPGMSSR